MDGPPLYREAVTFRSPVDAGHRGAAVVGGAPWVAIRHPSDTPKAFHKAGWRSHSDCGLL
jgi:hypothetical protein